MLHYVINILVFIIGAYFARYIAKQVAFYWKKRDDIVQIKFEQAREKKKNIENILNMVVTLSGERRKCAQTLIESIQDSQKDQDISKLRSLYKISVNNWSVGLDKINLNMNNVGLSSISRNMERDLHRAFFDSHEYLKKYFNSSGTNVELLVKVKDKLDESYVQTVKYSAILFDQAEKQLLQINDFYIDNLVSNEDLYKVSFLKHVKFIFYRRKNCFRIY